MNDNEKNLANKQSITPRPVTTSSANAPLGDKLRNLIQPAMEDSRRKQTQLDMLDKIFEQVGGRLEAFLNRALGDTFNRAANVERTGGQDALNMFMIQELTRHEGLDPVVRMGLPIATGFIEFSPQDITDLPGYIALHEKARELNIALKLVNVTMDETKSPNGAQPAMLIADISKSYEEGAMENAHLYPHLPPKKIEFDTRAREGFKF